MFTEFASSLDRFIIHTQLIPFHPIHKHYPSKILLKPENLQRYGCYKLRGLAAVVADASEEELQQGLAVASAGNMAQAAGFCAKKLGIPCRIYVPESAPEIKKQRIRELGAELIEMPYEKVWGFVRGDTPLPKDRLFVHPANNPSLLRGYGSIGYEILNEIPDVDAVVIPFGVGGLTLGIGKAIKNLNPDVAIIPCEPETASPLQKSLQTGVPSSVKRIPSFVDAIGTPEVLPEVFEEVRSMINESLVLSLDEIRESLRHLCNHQKLVCEGAAACAMAGALKLAQRGEYQKIVCILSGGNISFDDLKKIERL